MDNAKIIRDAINQVFTLREKAQALPQLGLAVKGVKRIQSDRFQTCYADLIASPEFSGATRFFLDELYGDADYSARDLQFARIAGTLSAVFPSSVVGTAVALAQLHALTEELDHLMAMECMAQGIVTPEGEVSRYMTAWRAVGRRSDRQHQLETVLSIGHKLTELTRKPGISIMLNLMRVPAARSGLASLQQFLERGFNLFASLSRTKGKADEFLRTIEYRENAWMNAMYEAPKAECPKLLSVAVGTEVTPRPPHRSVRAELPHTAPASGM